VINERANFDEGYFLGLKKDLLATLPNSYHSPAASPQIVQMLGMRGCEDKWTKKLQLRNGTC
jgi:hypothetical protein